MAHTDRRSPAPNLDRLDTETSGEIASHSRVEAIDYQELFTELTNRLTVFSQIPDTAPATLRIEGVALVGSFLTSGFEPGESDLDIVLILTEKYPDFSGYSRSIRRIERQFYDDTVFREFEGVPVKYIDVIEQTTPNDSITHEPYMKVLR